MKLVKYWWLIAMLVLCPIAYDPAGGQLRPFQEHFLEYMSIGFVCLFFENIWLTLFMLWNIFLYIYSGSEVGSMQVLNVFFACLVFRFTRAWFKKNKFDNCYKPILGMLVASLVFVVLQKLRIDPLSVPQDGAGNMQTGPMTQPCGLFGIPMAHGIFLAMCMPILASVNLFLAPLLLIPIYLCRSSAAVLAALAATGFYVYQLYKRWFIYFLGVLVLGGMLFVWYDTTSDPGTMKARFPMWSAVVKYSLHRPEGYGPDSFRNYNAHKDFKFNSDRNYEAIIAISPTHDESNIMATYYSPTSDTATVIRLNEEASKHGFPKNSGGVMELNSWDDPHNEYLKVLFEYGIPGFILLIGLIAEMIRRFRNTMKSKELVTVTACLIVFAVAAGSQFPLSIARLAVFFPILGGAFYAITDKDVL